MPVISRAIPTLLRGISQSSDATKKPDHAEIQDNANSDPILGLVKRSGTQFISNLISGETTIGNAKVHMINRDATERYVVIFSSTKVRVFELANITTGTPMDKFFFRTSNIFIFLFGKKPKKIKLLISMPERVSADITEHGPGMLTGSIPDFINSEISL